MKLADQWAVIEQNLPQEWEEVRLVLTTEQEDELARAAAVLGSLGAGRSGETLVFRVRRAGGGASPEAARRLFRRLDADRVWCRIEETGVDSRPVQAAEQPELAPLAEQFDAALSALPSDWSDLLGEVEISSSAWLDRTALLCAPINPSRNREAWSLLFRCARSVGYGVSVGMARRCFERLDEENITGSVRVLRALSETDPVGTQGPVFPIGGRVL